MHLKRLYAFDVSQCDVNPMDNEKKDDYIEMEFEIGDIEFEARGRSEVIERMFKLLIDKLETGGLVATLEIPDEDEWEEESWGDDEEEEEDWEEDEGEEESWGDDEEEEDSYDYEEDESYEYGEEDSLDYEAEDEEYANEEASDEEIPREAYLEPPPDWESLEEDSPPISESEIESDELKRDS